MFFLTFEPFKVGKPDQMHISLKEAVSLPEKWRTAETPLRIREADAYAKKLLVVAPDAADAYLGLGIANYFIGSLPGPKKFFLGFAGIHGNKKAGIQQIEIAADHGYYLRPIAKILLALAALREKNTEMARTQLSELVVEFPENPLFAAELAKLSPPPATAVPVQ
jgi:hypothetical protein